jgi:predicted CoA-substrate-specific enzyme activase
MNVCGCDLGSATGKAVIMNQGKIISSAVIKSTRNPETTAQVVIEEALKRAGLSSLDDLDCIIGTGYGRENVSFIHENISEITCHARGAYWMLPSVRTVIDIGGQDSKVMSLNGEGKIVDYIMNDKCAAGTGRFLEAMSRSLDCSMEELSQFSLQSETPVIISKQCSVFAESEVVTLINNGENIYDIVAGIHDSIARRIHAMAYKIGFKGEVVLTGGCAKNQGLIKSLEKRLDVIIHELPENPQIAGTIGAALFANDR